MKYKYIGEDPVLLIEQHQEVKNGDVIESDAPLDSAFLVLVEEKKKKEGDS